MKTTKAQLTADNKRLRADLAALSDLRSLRTFGRIAWTGGDYAKNPAQTGWIEAAVRRAMFREQINAFRGFWGDMPDLDTMRIFFRRARHDAYATFRGAFNA